MIKNKYVALIFRVFCFIFTLLGLLATMNVFNGSINFGQLMYYTILSNILALVLFGVLSALTIVDIRKNGKVGNAGYLPRFGMVCAIDLLLTLIVYWVLLAPGAFSMDGDHGLFTFSNLAVHLISPLMCLFDYILFTKPGRLKYRDIYSVLIFPLCYVLFTTITGFAGYTFRISSLTGLPVRFPYFFIDWDQLGAKVLIYIVALVLFFLLISHIMYWIDKKRSKKVGEQSSQTM